MSKDLLKKLKDERRTDTLYNKLIDEWAEMKWRIKLIYN